MPADGQSKIIADKQGDNWGLKAVRKALGTEGVRSPLACIQTTDIDATLKLVKAEYGELILDWTADARLNAFDGIIMGGALNVLGDFVQAHVFTSLLDRPAGFSTVDFHTRFLRPVPSGETYRIESRLIDRASRSAIIDTHIYRPDGKATTHITGAWQLTDRAFRLED
ncbi:PaaI family thioesterase [Ponticaulis profundi]|uniref:PaaI family thioesterase n=1 Tax=Ponticaulis profundi TaxID=2665222 RepID=A0ABW1SBF3_9PROT